MVLSALSVGFCLASAFTGGLGARVKRHRQTQNSTYGSCASYGCYSDYNPNLPCQCNSKCPQYGNCCSDFNSLCQGGGGGDSCASFGCGSSYDSSRSCQCDDQCEYYEECCSDYSNTCLGNPSPSPSPSPSPNPAPYPSPGGGGSGDAQAYWNGVNTNSASALRSRIQSGAKRISYGGLWTSYKSVWVGLPGGCSSGMNDIYSKKCWTPGSGQCGQYRTEGDCYNREHSWPKSWWGGAKNDAYSDMFHVMPSDGYVNSKRSNLLFGEVNSASYRSSEGCKVGGGVFEPTDRVKGLVARGSLYMELRYGYSQGSSYTDLLLKWHREHPPTAFEQEFNDRVQGEQGNRNPFIDFPEIAESIMR